MTSVEHIQVCGLPGGGMIVCDKDGQIIGSQRRVVVDTGELPYGLMIVTVEFQVARENILVDVAKV